MIGNMKEDAHEEMPGWIMCESIKSTWAPNANDYYKEKTTSPFQKSLFKSALTVSVLRGNLSAAPGACDLLASQRPDCSLLIVMMLMMI